MVITSKGGNAVLMSADEYAAWQETACLFRSPANARRRRDAADAASRGDLTEHPPSEECRRPDGSLAWAPVFGAAPWCGASSPVPTPDPAVGGALQGLCAAHAGAAVRFPCVSALGADAVP